MHEDLIGKKTHIVAKPENYTPPTNDPDDCICGGAKSGGTMRTLIANCPCCDGVQLLKEEICECPPDAHKMRVILPPNSSFRIRYIDNIEPIQ